MSKHTYFSLQHTAGNPLAFKNKLKRRVIESCCFEILSGTFSWYEVIQNCMQGNLNKDLPFQKTWGFLIDLQSPNPEITSKACHCLNEVLHDFKFTPYQEKHLSFMFKFDTQSSTCEGEGDNCETLLTIWTHPGLMIPLQSTVSTFVQGSMVILKLHRIKTSYV